MMTPPAHTAENVPLIAAAVWLDTVHWKFPQDEGLGATRLWEAHTPVIDGPDETLLAPALPDVLVAGLAFAKLDGLVGSSKLLVCWKPQAANVDVAAKAMSRRAKCFIE